MMYGNMCNDLMLDVFERLPPKSIIRFRSLSKYWYSRLASPKFLHAYRLRSSKNPQKVLTREDFYCNCESYSKDIYRLYPGDQFSLDPKSAVELDKVEFLSQICHTEVVGSCNGVLCLLNKADSSIRNQDFSLLNLPVRRRIIVPRHPLTFDSELVLGFGFDPITDDYKIVSISYRSEKLTTFLYSLKHGSWCEIPSPPTWLDMNSHTACFFNGILHWVVKRCSTPERTPKDDSYLILTFNVSTHVFGHILLPDQLLTCSHAVEQITTINGCLAVFSLEGDGSSFWLMKEYGKIESCIMYHKSEEQWLSGVMRVFQPTTNSDILAYPMRSTKFRKTLCIELMKFGPSLELVDKENATTCGNSLLDEKLCCSHI